MKTLKTVEVKLVYSKYCPPKSEMEQGIIYVSKEYNGSAHLCLCGCGKDCYLPLRQGEWSFTDNNGKATITPSIQQRFECKSHYIITNGKANFV